MYFYITKDNVPTKIYTLSLHDALPILGRRQDGSRDQGRGAQLVLVRPGRRRLVCRGERERVEHHALEDRKSTRLNSSHRTISYAVFCLKKKNKSPKHRAHFSYITN